MRSLWVVTAAVLVTVLWSTSYIINKFAFMDGIGPFMLSGLRYLTAVLTLWILQALNYKWGKDREVHAPKIPFLSCLVLGILGFLVAQGLQYGGQSLLTPTQSSLLLSIGNTFFVVLMDLLWLREIRSLTILAGIAAAMAGTLLYYYPWDFEESSVYGIGLMMISSIGYAAHLTMTRYLLHTKKVRSADLVTIPMFIGALGMILIGLITEGVPVITGKLILILLWLGSVNGALAFSLWAWTQKHLSAYKSNLINNLMLLEVVLLDIVFFSRSLTPLQIIGLTVTGAAILAVQLTRQRQT
ncbi:hypothetical protein PM3016_3869 [Paenibacillus mucilaginosus 3016]|uniref:EamA domain-containing protein n=1 Tax=Paenibacillus mucilaginosus 3016 TaxID=1116391 RepID=H6NFN6_9BACL|nr:DMT family transporter [Paenibacillus mucilaginosus]AFC30676.1 hypothetical protein PM3016_3869 [Paenibacillus mucilaginosus 3016]WFA19289.1 DMT family transporter [Paenibacillus mucilaginosus]